MGLAFSASDLQPAVDTLRTAGHEAAAQLLEGMAKEEIVLMSDLKTLVQDIHDKVIAPLELSIGLVLERVDRLSNAQIKMSAVTWDIVTPTKGE